MIYNLSPLKSCNFFEFTQFLPLLNNVSLRTTKSPINSPIAKVYKHKLKEKEKQKSLFNCEMTTLALGIDFNSCCRLCLSSGVKLISVFHENIIGLISNHLKILVFVFAIIFDRFLTRTGDICRSRKVTCYQRTSAARATTSWSSSTACSTCQLKPK